MTIPDTDGPEREDAEALRQDRPTAAQWRQWRLALQERLERLQEERGEATPEDLPAYDEKITVLKEQVAALRQEEWIAEFVENSARWSLARRHLLEEEEALPGDFAQSFGVDDE